MSEEDKKTDLNVQDEAREINNEEIQDEVKEPIVAEKGELDQEETEKAAAKAKAVSGDPEQPEYFEQVVKIKRVSKVVKGGKNFSFNALVIAGDGMGKVGIGFGKSNEVVGAIVKGTTEAKANFTKIHLKDDTIPHEIVGRFKSARVILKPASPGTGVIAGGPVRAMCDAVGIKNILTKSLGSRTAGNVVKATLDGFMKLRLKKRG